MYEWQDAYAIGVDSIDKAHKEMFGVMTRVDRILRQGGNLKWAVVESIKFFKSYAIRHFEDEENFMAKIGYTNLAGHRAVHEGMKNKILPRIHSELEYCKYSDESVQKYLSLCYKWLDRHIVFQDRELIKWVDAPTNE